ncbi:MAG: hypothetical protein P4N59_24405 [Negativicutes bacterium]|nr:hypothetical protein [Negativicutes bacterium]
MTMFSPSWNGFWLAGFNSAKDAQGSFGGGFAFHSMQVPLSNGHELSYDSTPIVFNSNTFTQGSNTAALNFVVTSSAGFSPQPCQKGIPGARRRWKENAENRTKNSLNKL